MPSDTAADSDSTTAIHKPCRTAYALCCMLKVTRLSPMLFNCLLLLFLFLIRSRSRAWPLCVDKYLLFLKINYLMTCQVCDSGAAAAVTRLGIKGANTLILCITLSIHKSYSHGCAKLLSGCCARQMATWRKKKWPCRAWPFFWGGQLQRLAGFQRLSSSALLTTVTELNAMAAPASMGLR